MVPLGGRKVGTQPGTLSVLPKKRLKLAARVGSRRLLNDNFLFSAPLKRELLGGMPYETSHTGQAK